MAMVSLYDILSPKSKIKRVVKVLHDGAASGSEFSIVLLELQDGNMKYAMRHDSNYWNPDNIDNGYPTVRGGRPSWFILPDLGAFRDVLCNINLDEFSIIDQKSELDEQ